MHSTESKVAKFVETVVVYGVGFPVVGLLMGGIYSWPAIGLCRGREPWLSLLLSLGLAVTIFGLGYLGATPVAYSSAAWVFAVMVLLVARRLYGNLHENLERFGLVHAIALIIASVLAATPAAAAPQDALARLAQAGTLACLPAHPVFCANIHVACAGPTALQTFAFQLRATRTRGSIEAGPGAAEVAQPYKDSRIEWDDKEGYVILRPANSNGYLKLLADGSYSFRHYSRHDAAMSRGHCR